MTPNEKLQKLFQAALAEPVSEVKLPTRAFPSAEAREMVPLPTSELIALPFGVAGVAPQAAPVAEIRPLANAGLSDREATELGNLLDEQRSRLRRQRLRAALITMGFFLVGTGGACGWFIQSPARMQAFREVMRDFRSAGNVTGMVAQYQLALDRIAVRSHQVDQATEAMGVSSDQSNGKDPNMEAEMAQMMGKDAKGKTVGQRNKLLQDNFGHMQKKTPAADTKAETKEAAAADEANSFDWKK